MNSGLTYEDLHWGDAPRRELDLYTLTGKARPLVEVTAISYVAIKDGQVDIFRHPFRRFWCPTERRKRYPYLLVADDDGPRTIQPIAKAAQALGRVIDFETLDGRILVGGYLIATHGHGRHLWICSDTPGSFGFETHPSGPSVKAEGIVD